MANFGLISSHPAVIKRVEKVCQQFGFTLKIWNKLEEYFDTPEECTMILASTVECKEAGAPAEHAQCIRQLSQTAFIALVVEKKLREADVVFVNKSGAGVVMLFDEFENTSKLEFVCNQVIRTSYVPIKVIDLIPDQILTFDIYHLLPQAKKFIPFAFEVNPIDAKKLKILSEVGEFYIRREQAAKYRQYVKDTAKLAADQNIRECRSQFLMLLSGFNDLVFNLTDRGGYASFDAGSDLLKDIGNLAKSLIFCLRATNSAWEIVDQMAIGAAGAIERAPARAAYAALFGISGQAPNLESILMGSLISDLGTLSLNPEISAKLRDQKPLTADEENEYRSYPRKSLQILLERKLQINETLRTVICSKNERADGSGFPNHSKADHIPEECRFIHLADLFDEKTSVKIGERRKSRAEALEEILKDENGFIKDVGIGFLPTFRLLRTIKFSG